MGHRRVAMATARPVWSLNDILASRPGSWWPRQSIRTCREQSGHQLGTSLTLAGGFRSTPTTPAFSITTAAQPAVARTRCCFSLLIAEQEDEPFCRVIW